MFENGLFGNVPRLETDRLILRALRMSDADDLHTVCSNPNVARSELWAAHRSKGETRALIRFAKRQYRLDEPPVLAIERREDGRVIGTVSILWISGEHRSAEVGYSIAEDCWGRGYATEALRAVIRYALNDLGLNRVEAMHGLDNPASGRVMEKAGMKREGILRERVCNKGTFTDVALYAILKKDGFQ